MEIDLILLASKIESLPGPDREVDVQLADLTWWDNGRVHRLRNAHPTNTWEIIAEATSHDENLRSLPSYTASIDAAMTLVPEGFSGQLWLRFNEGRRQRPRAAIWSHNGEDCKRSKVNLEVTAATPALALLAAALRAQANLTEQSGDVG